MQWASTVTSDERLDEALGHAVDRIGEELAAPPDLAFCFVSTHYRSDYATVGRLLNEQLGAAQVFGCSGGGVIGGGREIEQAPGFSLTAAILPDVDVVVRRVAPDALPELSAGWRAWGTVLGVPSQPAPAFVLLADPYSFPLEPFLRGLDLVYPASTKVGGMASGGREAGGNALWLGDACYTDGLISLALSGNISLQALVSQGCRPIGEPMFVTRAHGNLLIELDGLRPIRVLETIYAGLDAHDRTLMRHSLFLGVVMRPEQSEYHHGDFLIRNVVGSDQESGALWIGAELEENQVVQFHLRDAETSARDLEVVLAPLDHTSPPSGSLLFSCVGRGEYLYGEPNHDSRVFQRHFGDVPLGGFFCNGEIGPVQGRTYLHGYTSAFGIFRPRQP